MDTTLSSQDVKVLQRSCAQTASLLMALALLTGLYMSLVAMKIVDAQFHTVLSAHLNALLGCFWLLGVGWSLQFFYGTFSHTQKMIRLMSLANYSNWSLTLLKAHLHVAGIKIESNFNNNAILIILTLFVVLPALWSTWMWIQGLHKTIQLPST